MNKTELVNAVAAKAGLTKVDAKKALDATVEAIVEAVKKGDKARCPSGCEPRHRCQD